MRPTRLSVCLGFLALALALSPARPVAGADTYVLNPATNEMESAKGPFVYQNSFTRYGVSRLDIFLTTLDPKTGPAASAAKEAPPARPKPKLRPRLLGLVDPATGKPMKVSESPQAVEANQFMSLFATRISAEWDKAARQVSSDWHPEIEVHFIFSVDVEKGTVAIESRSAPADPAGLERFHQMLESLAPVTLPEILRTMGGKELRFQLDFKNVKEPPLPPLPAGKG